MSSNQLDKIQQSHIISECCNAFTIIDKKEYICTKCGQPCKDIAEGDTAMIINKYNINAKNNINNVFNTNLWHDAMNWYNDETLRLVNHKCDDCGSYCRFARDLTGEIIYICSNKNCRHVFSKYGRVDEVFNSKKVDIQ